MDMEKDMTDVLGSPLQILNDTFEHWFGVGIAPFITAVIFLVLTMLLSMMLTRVLRKIFTRSGALPPSGSVFITIIRAAVWVLGFSVMFSVCFGIDMTALIAALGIGGVALSLGLQDTISNLVGGINIGLSHVVRPGDYVEFEGQQGVIHDTNWRYTTIAMFAGGYVAVPNSKINSSAMVVHPSIRKVKVRINVSKEVSDLDTVSGEIGRAVERALAPYGGIADGPVVLFQSITEYGYQGTVHVWMDLDESQVNYLELQNVMIHAIAPFSYPRTEEQIAATAQATGLPEGGARLLSQAPAEPFETDHELANAGHPRQIPRVQKKKEEPVSIDPLEALISSTPWGAARDLK